MFAIISRDRLGWSRNGTAILVTSKCEKSKSSDEGTVPTAVEDYAYVSAGIQVFAVTSLLATYLLWPNGEQTEEIRPQNLGNSFAV